MAKNGQPGHGRVGPIKDRTQFYNPVTERWQKGTKIQGK